MLEDDKSNEFATHHPNTSQMNKPNSAAGRSFGANETAKTFVGFHMEGAI